MTLLFLGAVAAIVTANAGHNRLLHSPTTPLTEQPQPPINGPKAHQQTASPDKAEGIGEWVRQEIEQARGFEDFLPLETFVFLLKPGQSVEFMWTLKGSRRQCEFLVQLFRYERGDDPVLNTDPSLEEWVSIESRSGPDEPYVLLGRVHTQKNFQLLFPEDFRTQQIRLMSRQGKPLLAQVTFETQPKLLRYLSDRKSADEGLGLTARKLESVFTAFQEGRRKEREQFKWSFLEKERRHQDDMLFLAAVELVGIAVTAVVQFWCLTSLLEGRTVV